MSFFPSLLFLLQNLDYTHNTHFHMCKFIFYTICRDIRSSRMYWARGPVQGHLTNLRMDKHMIEVSIDK